MHNQGFAIGNPARHLYGEADISVKRFQIESWMHVKCAVKATIKSGIIQPTHNFNRSELPI
jgi:hypothetical protein